MRWCLSTRDNAPVTFTIVDFVSCLANAITVFNTNVTMTGDTHMRGMCVTGSSHCGRAAVTLLGASCDLDMSVRGKSLFTQLDFSRRQVARSRIPNWTTQVQ